MWTKIPFQRKFSNKLRKQYCAINFSGNHRKSFQCTSLHISIANFEKKDRCLYYRLF